MNGFLVKLCFRDPRVWTRTAEGHWLKDTIWDAEARKKAGK